MSIRPLRFASFVVALAAMSSLLASVAVATDDLPEEATGYQESGYDLSKYENINLANGNLTFRIPLHTLRTDGGLSYELALTYNSTGFAHRWYCYDGNVPEDECRPGHASHPDDRWYSRTVRDGVRAYGWMWDMRPPRIIIGAGRETLREPLAWVDTSGAKHYLVKHPPWDIPAEGNQEDCELIAIGDRCYTADGTNYRLTLIENADIGDDIGVIPARVDLEDGSGTVYVHTQLADPRYYHAKSTDSQADFKLETAGLYLTEIQRGPWIDAGGDPEPANSIAFEYKCQFEPSNPDYACLGDERPWMVERIVASGEHPREVEILYDVVRVVPADPPDRPDAVNVYAAQSVLVPSFDPGGLDEPAEIVLRHDEGTYQPSGDDVVRDYPLLSGILFPDGTGFEFTGFRFDWSNALLFPFHSVVLPTGATVEYRDELVETGIRNCLKGDDGDCTYSATCGASKLGPERTAGKSSLVGRTKRYSDATGSERVETTWFTYRVNCSPTNDEGWPYDFHYADLGVHEGTGPYKWTWVQTISGTDAADWDASSTYAAEIHRFHIETLEEFSADLVESQGYWPNPLEVPAQWDPDYDYGREVFAGVTRLKHDETQMKELFDQVELMAESAPGTYPRPELRYTYVEEARLYSNEAAGWNNNDVGGCYLPCTSTDFQQDCPVPSSCTIQTTHNSVDDYLNVESSTVSSQGEVSGFGDTERITQAEYLNVLGSSNDWFLGMKTRNVLTEIINGTTTNATERAYTWLPASLCRDQPGTSPRSHYLLCHEFLSPRATGTYPPYLCDAIDGDCVEHVYRYDDLGNRIRDKVKGGYSSAPGVPGHGSLELSTRYDFRHGVPVRKWLESSGGGSRLLWERDVHAATGLPLWHLGGHGSGFAYLFDSLGRITDIAPVDGEYDGGSWTLSLPRTFDATGSHLMKGTAIDYVRYDDPSVPSGYGLRRHLVSDAEYSLGGGVLTRMTTGTERSRFVFDGLGRLTQESSHTPQGTRSRFHLRFLESDGCDGSPGLEATTPGATRIVEKTSEWTLATEWPGSCDALSWTTTRYDAASRPLLAVQPDGSSTELIYRGLTCESASTYSPDGSTQTAKVNRISDHLGRLRRVNDWKTDSEILTTTYFYDENGQVTWYGNGSQHRNFRYTDTGWLKWSSEPERTVTIQGIDATGNLRRSFINVVGGGVASTTVDGYDEFGRRVTRTTDGALSSEWVYGDSAAGGSAQIGDDGYLRMVGSTQHNNYFTPISGVVEVGHRWTHNAVGGRVGERLTTISGVGQAGQGFVVRYGYDPWGNIAAIEHPHWDGSCSETALEYFRYDGEWQLDADMALGDDTASAVGVSQTYHPSGRPATVDYYDGNTLSARLSETADPSGLARPHRYTLTWDPAGAGTTLWTEGDYAYDGSGNITAIGAKQYTYDLLGRLTSFTSDPVHSTTESYEVDRFGNLWRLTHNGVVTEFTGLAPDNRPDAVAVGSATRTLAWDALGNLERLDLDGGARKVFEFSAEDRLMSSTHDPTPGAPGDETTWLYAYDAAGERVARWRRGPAGTLEAGDPPEEVLFTMRDEGGRVLSDWQLIPDGWFTRTRDYLYAGGRLAAQVDWSTGEPESTFVATDHLGSTRALFTSAQDVEEIEYLPYGGFLTGGPVPGSTHLFTGHERDLGEYSSELDYMHARYYSSDLGRFLSIDPVGGEVGSILGWNRYSYALNNPIGLLDPDGRDPFGALSVRNATRHMSRSETQSFIESQTKVERRVAVASAPFVLGLALPAVGVSGTSLVVARTAGLLGGGSSAFQSYLAGGDIDAIINAGSSGACFNLVTTPLLMNSGFYPELIPGLSAGTGVLWGQAVTEGPESIDSTTLLHAALAAAFASGGWVLAEDLATTELGQTVLTLSYQAGAEWAFVFSFSNAEEGSKYGDEIDDNETWARKRREELRNQE